MAIFRLPRRLEVIIKTSSGRLNRQENASLEREEVVTLKTFSRRL